MGTRPARQDEGLTGLVLVVISIFNIPTGLGRLDGRVYAEWLPVALVHTALLLGGIALFFFGLFYILRCLSSRIS